MATYPAYGVGGYGDGAYPAFTEQGRETAVVNKSLTPLPPPVFTGMKLQQDVSIGSLVLNKIDSNNVIWVCTDIEGWWQHPDPELPDVPRGWGDGSYDASGRWAARQITLKGVILPPEPQYLPAARDTFIRELDLVRRGAWLKTNENPTRASYVRLSGRPELQTVNAKGRTEFSVGLRAADPIKYSWNNLDVDGYNIVTLPGANVSTSATGITTINNVGNTPVTVFFEFAGPITAPATVTNSTTGDVLTVVSPLRAAESWSVTTAQVVANVAKLTTSTGHAISPGDVVTVENVGSSIDGVFEVLDTPTTTTFTYSVTATNFGPSAVAASVSRDTDILEVDTYTKEVALNGVTLGARTYVDTLTDWTTLSSGINEIEFADKGNPNSTAALRIFYRSGWIG